MFAAHTVFTGNACKSSQSDKRAIILLKIEAIDIIARWSNGSMILLSNKILCWLYTSRSYHSMQRNPLEILIYEVCIHYALWILLLWWALAQLWGIHIKICYTKQCLPVVLLLVATQLEYVQCCENICEEVERYSFACGIFGCYSMWGSCQWLHL